jgi:putative endonuclease
MAVSMFYVYSIQSEANPNLYYVGITANIEKRLAEHNSGKSIHTNKNSPWKLLVYVAFTDKSKAEAFEKYLKTGSGRMFSIRHF